MLTKNITRQPQSNGRVLLRADITATVDTTELDNFLAQEREQRQQAIQRYKDLQAMNEKVKRDIDALQTKLAAIKEEVKDDELQVEQERINREFLSKKKVEEFAYKPFQNEEVKYDITRIKYDMSLIDEVIKFNPKNISAHVMKAFFVSQRSTNVNDINKALALTSDPKTSAALYAMRGLCYSIKGDLNRALEDYNKAIQLDPKSSIYYQVRAGFYESRLKDYDKALADYNMAIKLNPKNVDSQKSLVELYKSRIKLYESQKKYSEAIEDYKSILTLVPEELDGFDYNNVGDMYKDLKDYPNAIEWYTKAINLKPEYEFADHRVDAYLRRARLYAEQEEYDKVIADCDTGIALTKSAMEKNVGTNPDFSLKDAYDLVSIPALEKTKRKALRAKDLTDKYGNIDINNIEALVERGNAYYDAYTQDYQKVFLEYALKDYTRVLKLDPKNQLAYEKRGVVYGVMGNYKADLADFNALIKINPSYEYAYSYRGWIYEKLEDWNKALADYNKALELYPNKEFIEEKRQRVLDKMKK